MRSGGEKGSIIVYVYFDVEMGPAVCVEMVGFCERGVRFGRPTVCSGRAAPVSWRAEGDHRRRRGNGRHDEGHHNSHHFAKTF